MNFNLRPWQLSDIESLIKYANNYEIAKNLTNHFPHPYTRESGENYIAMATREKPFKIMAIELGGEAVLKGVRGQDLENPRETNRGLTVNEAVTVLRVISSNRSLHDSTFSDLLVSLTPQLGGLHTHELLSLLQSVSRIRFDIRAGLVECIGKRLQEVLGEGQGHTQENVSPRGVVLFFSSLRRLGQDPSLHASLACLDRLRGDIFEDVSSHNSLCFLATIRLCFSRRWKRRLSYIFVLLFIPFCFYSECCSLHQFTPLERGRRLLYWLHSRACGNANASPFPFSLIRCSTVHLTAACLSPPSRLLIASMPWIRSSRPTLGRPARTPLDAAQGMPQRCGSSFSTRSGRTPAWMGSNLPSSSLSLVCLPNLTKDIFHSYF